GQSFVNKILRGKSLKLDNNIEQKGFKIMFTMRVSMVFPHDALSYAAGLSKIKYKDFILATCLGMIPEVLAYSILGKSAEKILSIKFLIYTINKLGPYKYLVFAGLIILIAIIIYFHNKNKAKKASYIKDEEIIQEENDNIEK
ncbi:MAG: VTT domain-containing protein, partial [Bacillota bacterium]|nr:VTT domain-containing protein [Bacillota bacterium]